MSRKRLHHTHLSVISDIMALVKFTDILCDGQSEILSWISQETGKLNTIKFTQREYVKANDRNNNSDMPNAEENGGSFEADSNQYVEARGTCHLGFGVHPSNDDTICAEN